MYVTEDKVTFETCDQAFVRKFGVAAATEMVLDYKTVRPLPFLYDTYQLSHFLGVGRKDFFKLLKSCNETYRPILLKKRNGKIRHIYAPQDDLKTCQQKILSGILMKLPISEYATAYIQGGSLFRNASPHVGKRYLLKLDLTDFFGSIHFDQVYAAAFHTRYFPKQIGVILATLCCRKDVLPQGAPTSPCLSNIVFRNFDDAIGRWCRQRAVTYTRYCDDMTFSSDQPLFPVYQKVKRILEETTLELNEKKTRFITNGGRQSVTGLTVNEKVSVSRDYKRRLRGEVHYALKFGIAESIRYADKTKFFTDGAPDVEKYYRRLLGQIGFVLQIEPENKWFQNAWTELKNKYGS